MVSSSSFRQFIATTLLVSALAGGCSNAQNAQPPEPPPVAVELQTVTNTTVQDSSEFVGALEAQERVELRPETEGRVVAIAVSSGQPVESGTLILQLRSDQNEAEVTGAGADVEAARAAVNTANAKLKAAEAERDRAAADVRLQTEEYRRTAQLVAEGAQSRQALDRAINTRDTATASLRAEEEQVGVAQAELAEATARLQRAQADRAVAGSNLREAQVRSPIAGVVGSVAVKVGDYVTPQNVLTSIIQNQALELNLAVPVERGDRLRVGLPVELLDGEGQPAVIGQISFVSPQVNTAEQSILAKASFPNNGSLRDGQFVRARVIWERGSGITVPTAAITRVAGQPFVFVAEAGEPSPSGEATQVAKQRPVTLGAIQGNNYNVLSGINPGDQVIVSGVLNLSDGASIMTGPPPAPGGQP